MWPVRLCIDYAQKRAGVRCDGLLSELWRRQRCDRCPSPASGGQEAGQRKHVTISYSNSKCSMKIQFQLNSKSEFLGVGWQRPNQGGSTILRRCGAGVCYIGVLGTSCRDAARAEVRHLHSFSLPRLWQPSNATDEGTQWGIVHDLLERRWFKNGFRSRVARTSLGAARSA